MILNIPNCCVVSVSRLNPDRYTVWSFWLVNLILPFLLKTFLWLHSAYKIKKKKNHFMVSEALHNLAPVDLAFVPYPSPPCFPPLACSVFTDTDLFLKSSSCIHLVNPYSSSGLSLISFSWMLASPSLPRLNHFDSLSEHHVRLPQSIVSWLRFYIMFL